MGYDLLSRNSRGCRVSSQQRGSVIVKACLSSDTAITRWCRQPLFLISRFPSVSMYSSSESSVLLSHETRCLPRHCLERNAVRATVNLSGRAGPTNCLPAPVIHEISHGVYAPRQKGNLFNNAYSTSAPNGCPMPRSQD